MKKFILIGLSLLSLSNLSAQSSDEIKGLSLSHEFLESADISDEFMEDVDDPAAIDGLLDSVSVSAYFTVTDLAGLQGISIQLSEAGESVYSETHFPIGHYSSDYESGLYRENNYFITQLGHYPFSDIMLVKVKLEYIDRQTAYYSASINE